MFQERLGDTDADIVDQNIDAAERPSARAVPIREPISNTDV
jgi:hypothetical protein